MSDESLTEKRFKVELRQSGVTLDVGADEPIYKAALKAGVQLPICLLYTSPSPRDGLLSRMPSSA